MLLAGKGQQGGDDSFSLRGHQHRMKILFITTLQANYVPDLLLHGLRKLMGPDVVDFPKKECLYQGILGLIVCPDDQLCPGWFPPDNGDIDREDIGKKVDTGYFQYIISDYRALHFLLENLSSWPSGLVVVDGEDTSSQIPIGRYVICRRETDGSDFSIPLPMALPEEILQWISSYHNTPKEYSIGFLGSTIDGERRRTIETVAKDFPDALFRISDVPSEDNPAPKERLTRDDYYLNLQKCQIVLSLPGAGYDTFRFWENAACNAIHVALKVPLFIPNDFVDGEHILRFTHLDELRRKLDQVLERKIKSDEMISKGRFHLTNYHLTTNRAKYFLDRIKCALD
jgi:hypothetical protein